tara:strand:+ start:471 stop:587 length:117 start_codon:yes stop_codon:yes gene_type:complete
MLHFISDAAPRRHREGELREAHLRLIKLERLKWFLIFY